MFSIPRRLLEEAACLAVLLLGLVGGLQDLLLEQRAAVGLGLDLSRLDHAVGAAGALGLDLVAQRDRGDVAGLLALEARLRAGRHALTIDDQQPILTPLQVAFDPSSRTDPADGAEARPEQGAPATSRPTCQVSRQTS